MQFNVARLLKATVGTHKNFSLDESFVPFKETRTDRVEGRLRLLRTDAGIWASGKLQAPATVSCVRCLQDCTTQVHFTMDDVYYPKVDVNTGVKLPASDDEDNQCFINSQHILDISESVRQYVLLNLPMKPLCETNCAGLCSRCGMNLNGENCSCNMDEIDPRWLPLLSTTFTTQDTCSRR
ncbi:MAG: hypothetical protein BZY82_04085 [SAR202 cluster bacterium Io17-Chloro-G3]|nr:MAG: hypothetical protein BZY82_04085 [SAR202 cluster bacterium Io17-Chloro-G3]